MLIFSLFGIDRPLCDATWYLSEMGAFLLHIEAAYTRTTSVRMILMARQFSHTSMAILLVARSASEMQYRSHIFCSQQTTSEVVDFEQKKEEKGKIPLAF